MCNMPLLPARQNENYMNQTHLLTPVFTVEWCILHLLEAVWMECFDVS